ncbi:acyltransferase [Tardiphaga sp.]|uniref:acyltransferase family protein n=1 Tax=Tardiphaga sp. TaxID=1926292 RepID=UPI002614F960|nr:acyltransferase [Tardiphaga sp.]MDB5617757.1 acyltransferase 3 [Tardiphaga sp.]
MSILGSTQKRLEKFPAFGALAVSECRLSSSVISRDVLDSGLYNILWKANRVSRIGLVALDIFFAICGFFITRLLLRERATTGHISFKNFYSRRALRIFSIYYLTVFFCYFIFHLKGPDTFSLLTYTFNFYHPFHSVPHPLELTWSLSVEEQFYFFWPQVILLPPPRVEVRS